MTHLLASLYNPLLPTGLHLVSPQNILQSQTIQRNVPFLSEYSLLIRVLGPLQLYLSLFWLSLIFLDPYSVFKKRPVDFYLKSPCISKVSQYDALQAMKALREATPPLILQHIFQCSFFLFI